MVKSARNSQKESFRSEAPAHLCFSTKACKLTSKLHNASKCTGTKAHLWELHASKVVSKRKPNARRQGEGTGRGGGRGGGGGSAGQGPPTVQSTRGGPKPALPSDLHSKARPWGAHTQTGMGASKPPEGAKRTPKRTPRAGGKNGPRRRHLGRDERTKRTPRGGGDAAGGGGEPHTNRNRTPHCTEVKQGVKLKLQASVLARRLSCGSFMRQKYKQTRLGSHPALNAWVQLPQ